VKNFNILIDHQCPQCGAPATLGETDRLFTCEFCKVKSYLVPGEYFQYQLPHKAPSGKSLLYFPYWRFKGMMFSCISEEIKEQFIDVSHQAVESKGFPYSLGFRSQALKLRFVSPENGDMFLPPAQSFDKVYQTFEAKFESRLPKPIFHHAHIGENLSLIYAPYYLDNKVYDAVLNEASQNGSPEEFEALRDKCRKPGWQLRFLSTLCPKCGWDLEGDKDSLVLLCHNCNSAWKPGSKRLQRLKFGYIPSNDKDVVYLPFWRIRTEISGLELDTFADLVKIANLPKIAKPEWQEIPFRFWSLGLKIRPQTFLPLTTKMTLSQPLVSPVFDIPPGELYPVNLPVEEAVEGLKVMLANFIKPRNLHLPRLNEIQITPKSYLLLYLPFRDDHHELIQPELKFSILKSQLRMAKNL
jgi:hypothetical protein